MNRPSMHGFLLTSCVVWGAMCTPHCGAVETDRLAKGYQGMDCQTYHAYVTSKAGLESGVYKPYQLENAAENCVSNGTQIELVLRQFFEYMRSSIERDFPNSQARPPGFDVDAMIDKDLIKIKMALPKFKAYDPVVVSQVLHFMASRPNDGYKYAWAALEIVARDFPKDYDSYKGIVPQTAEGQRMWQFTKDRWLNVPPDDAFGRRQ